MNEICRLQSVTRSPDSSKQSPFAAFLTLQESFENRNKSIDKAELEDRQIALLVLLRNELEQEEHIEVVPRKNSPRNLLSVSGLASILIRQKIADSTKGTPIKCQRGCEQLRT
ncbi:hypothetical protein L596_024013 [Steinernema carpocapsae]|uniref:Uncharacterized protein n=1 Tax=Steinernema carpocapsae TaxID=34508 RepID=A0A4U5MG51_STECR|nr:hypothetical protein L596_024013 [Steinernema carpocapsae]